METDASTGRIVVKPALEAVGAHDGPLDIDCGHLLVSDSAALDFTAADDASTREDARERRVAAVSRRIVFASERE